MLTKFSPLVRKLHQQPVPAKAVLAAVVFLLTIVAFLVRHFRSSGGTGGDRRHDSGSHTSDDKRTSSALSSSSSTRRHKHGSSSKKHRHSHSKKPDSSLPSMYVLVGVHGSGKSTWAKQFVEKVRKSAIIVCSDTFRAAATGSVDDYSREDEVREELLKEIEHQIEQRRTIIVDDCQHNLDQQFRATLLGMAKEGEYNRIIRRFPIKAIFARTRIDKDLAEGKKRQNPSQLVLEQLIAKYDAAGEAIDAEGWYEDK